MPPGLKPKSRSLLPQLPVEWTYITWRQKLHHWRKSFSFVRPRYRLEAPDIPRPTNSQRDVVDLVLSTVSICVPCWSKYEKGNLIGENRKKLRVTPFQL